MSAHLVQIRDSRSHPSSITDHHDTSRICQLVLTQRKCSHPAFEDSDAVHSLGGDRGHWRADVQQAAGMHLEALGGNLTSPDLGDLATGCATTRRSTSFEICGLKRNRAAAETIVEVDSHCRPDPDLHGFVMLCWSFKSLGKMGLGRDSVTGTNVPTIMRLQKKVTTVHRALSSTLPCGPWLCRKPSWYQVISSEASHLKDS